MYKLSSLMPKQWLGISASLLLLSCVQSTLSEAPPCIEANNCFIVDMNMAKTDSMDKGKEEDLMLAEQAFFTDSTLDLSLIDIQLLDDMNDISSDLEPADYQMDATPYPMLDQFQVLPTEVTLLNLSFIKGDDLSLIKAELDVIQHRENAIPAGEYLYVLRFFNANAQLLFEKSLSLIPRFQNQQQFQLALEQQLDERVALWKNASYITLQVLEQSQAIFESMPSFANPPVILGVGELCTPNQIDRSCPTLSPCLEQGDSNIFRCTTATNPVIRQAWAQKIPLNQQLAISARGLDNDSNCCARMLVELLDENGVALELNASQQSTRVAYTLDQNAFQSDGQGYLSFLVGRVIQNLPLNTWDKMVEMKISLKDILQNESNIITVPIEQSNALQVGEACYGSYWGSCVAGTICQKESLSCGVGTAPRIIQGRAIKGSQQWKLSLDYEDLDLNASMVEIQALDTTDQVINGPEDQWSLPVLQENLQASQSIELFFNPPANAGLVRSILVRVKDQLNLSSESRIIGLETPISVGLNDICDEFGFISICTDPLSCYAPPYDQPAQATCMSDLPVLRSAQVVLDTNRTRMPIVENNRLSFQFEFDTPVDELSVFRFELERNGSSLLVNGLPYQDVVLNQPISFNGRLNYFLDFGAAPVPANVDFIKVAFKNRFGFWTQGKRIAVFPVSFLVEGDICDDRSVLSICQPDQDLQCINQACQFHIPANILAPQSAITYSNNALRFALTVQNGTLALLPKVCFALFDAQQQPMTATSSAGSFKVCSNESPTILSAGSLNPMQQANLYFAINSNTCIGCPNAAQVDVWVEDIASMDSPIVRFPIVH